MLFLFYCFLIFAYNLSSQTVGVIEYKANAMEGYTFFSPFSGTKAYMVDNCGNLINEWDRGTNPGLSAYFLENGLMFRTYKADLNGPFTSASNMGGLELVNWDNEVVWSYEINTEEQLSHHDAVYMPNGNILVLTWQLVYKADLIQFGRDPNEIAQENFMWSERIVELKPIGTDQAEIVWEWNIYDHYIQDFDESKDNFGVVSEHPELFNINLPELNSNNSNSTRDWNHFNAIDYNADLDQILISVRNSDEFWILDHSTTTEEAATHSNGTYGKGGDILYRWGNAYSYGQADLSDEKLFGQHGVHWIKDGLEDAGKIIVFNNGNHRPGLDYSQIDIVDPPQTEAGFYKKEIGVPYGPTQALTIYGDGTGETFFSAYLSNPQRLVNGNNLINAGSPGKIFEITPEREIVWEYEIPLFGDFPASQGDNVTNNSSFRAYKFPLDYPGFDGIDIIPGLPIESNPNDCDILVNTSEIEESNSLTLSYDRSGQRISIHGLSASAEIYVHNAQGHLILTKKLSMNDNSIQFSNNLPSQVYILRVEDQIHGTLSKKIFVY